jgi:hypothetical protein
MCVVPAITTNFNLRIRGTPYLPGGFCCAAWSLPLIAGGYVLTGNPEVTRGDFRPW